MKTTATRAAFFIVPVALALLLGCKAKPVPTAPPPAPPSQTFESFGGLWEGRDADGGIITLRFKNAEWEVQMDKGGGRLPYCRGTYTFSGPNIYLQVTQETDPITLEWVPQKGNFPREITGRLAGGKLKVPGLTEAELKKK